MYSDCHAIVGWTIGNIVPSDVRLRRWATAAAVLPDIDALPILFGTQYYAEYHHTFGHSLFLWITLTGLTAYRLRSLKAVLVVFASFGSHLLADSYFTGLPFYFFWPFSQQSFLFLNSPYILTDPINTQLFYVGLVVVFWLTVLYRRSPLELFSRRLDHLLISMFKRRVFQCRTCGRKSNQKCGICSHPVCWRHAAVTRSCQVVCPNCRSRKI